VPLLEQPYLPATRMMRSSYAARLQGGPVPTSTPLLGHNLRFRRFRFRCRPPATRQPTWPPESSSTRGCSPGKADQCGGRISAWRRIADRQRFLRYPSTWRLLSPSASEQRHREIRTCPRDWRCPVGSLTVAATSSTIMRSAGDGGRKHAPSKHCRRSRRHLPSISVDPDSLSLHLVFFNIPYGDSGELSRRALGKYHPSEAAMAVRGLQRHHQRRCRLRPKCHRLDLQGMLRRTRCRLIVSDLPRIVGGGCQSSSLTGGNLPSILATRGSKT